MSIEKIRWNATDLAGPDFSNCDNLSDLVACIEGHVKAQGRVVCAVSVNGLDLTESDELRLGSTLKKDIDFIEVDAERPEELMRSTVQSQIELMNEIDRVAQAAAQSFRDLDLSRGHELLISLLDGCRWFTDSLLALRHVTQALSTDGEFAPAWRGAEVRLQQILAEILKAVEAEDKVLLADLLEYELANSLEPWQELLKSLPR